VIDDEIAKLLADAHTRVTETLTTRRPELDALAKLLLEREVVDRAALDQLLSRPKA
jgi:cell division protease FtsH